MSQNSNTPRAGGLVSSQGVEWSFIWMVGGVLGMVLLLFSLLNTRSDEKTPTYEGGSQINPLPPRAINDQPEVGVSEATEST